MADESPQEPDAFEEMEISREAKPEVKVHFDRIEELCVEDEEGLLYRFGDLYKDRKTIIILIRVRIKLVELNTNVYVLPGNTSSGTGV